MKLEIMFACVAFATVATVGAQSASAQSCVGHCGGASTGCYCDSVCTSAGDCCSDYEAVCLGDGGGGGGGDSCSCTDASGNMSIAGSYGFDSAQTGYAMVPAAAFSLGVLGQINYTVSQFGHGGLALQGSEGSEAFVNLAAPVHLPAGATPVDVTCEVSDFDSAQSGSLRMDFLGFELGAGSYYGGRLELTSSAAHSVGTVPITGIPASATPRMYYLVGTFSQSARQAQVTFAGCSVSYTTDRLAP